MNKMPLKKVRWIFIAIILLGAAMGYIGAYAQWDALVILGIAALLGAMIFHIAFYRCPHCGSYLYRHSGLYCSQCGKKLDE